MTGRTPLVSLDSSAADQRLSGLLRNATDVALVLDGAGRFVYVSPAIGLQFGYEQGALERRSGRDFNHPDDRDLVSAAWRQILSAPDTAARVQCRVLHADGTWRWADHTFTNLLDDPSVGGVVANVRKVADRRRSGRPQQDAAAAITDLRRGLAAGELRLHYQPVVDVRTDEMTGVEALVRWQHPERGLLLPAEFVPLAESCGLIGAVGTWVLGEACRTAAAWQREGRTWTVSVNLSPVQLASGTVVEVVAAVLAETQADPGSLVLEVTESALIDDGSALATLVALRGLGFRLALDDFGTGYCSLTYLRRFPVDALKIDRSFVAGLGRHVHDDAIVASVASLGRAVGKLVVAEGVETPEQRRMLGELCVDLAQGFLWSAALPGDELERWDDMRRRRFPTGV